MRLLPRGSLAALATLVTLATALALVPSGAAAAAGARSPDLSAAAWLLVDSRDGTVLDSRAAGEQRSIASTTKLMTAYVALGRLDLGQRLTVPDYSPAAAESVAGLTEGERLTVRDLLEAMLVASANDAAETIAVGVGGSEGAFVELMNREAARLGLDDTRYSNPIGLDEIGNYSSAEDLATLTRALLEDPRFRRIVALTEADLGSGAVPRRVVSTNTLLLADPSVNGVKTGHTLDAGYVLVASAKRRGVPLLAVVLGASSEAARDAETEQLLDYGYSLYRPVGAFARDEQLAATAVRYGDEPLSLVAARRIVVQARSDQQLATSLDAPDGVAGPIAAGERLGSATVTLDGVPVGRSALLAGAAVAAPSFVDRLGGPWALAGIVIGVLVILILVAYLLRGRVSRPPAERRSAEERMASRRERTRTTGDRGGTG